MGGLSPESRVTTPRVAVVVPCFNEQRRLAPHLVAELIEVGGCDLVLVDDGSTDGTLGLLESLAAETERITVLALEVNSGKAEAVRRGLVAAVDAGYDIVGYADADFATPPGEIARLIDLCRADGRRVVIGSRVGLLGHHIDRSAMRHYTGRVFGTLGSLLLGFQVYDTQCGAKLFRVDEAFRAAIGAGFVSRWSFDVELLGRLATPRGTAGFLEVPLTTWREVGGSKLNIISSIKATAELWTIHRSLRRWRAEHR